MPQVTVQEVTVETVKKGRNSYQVANVVYTDKNGENKTKKIMSFSNPGVFDTAQKAQQGEVYEVSYTPGDQYYNWATMKQGGPEPATANKTLAAPASGKVIGSTYETAEERKIKQLYIVRQSSISNAIEYCAKLNNEEPFALDFVLDVAQKFVDFVYGTEDLVKMDSDI